MFKHTVFAKYEVLAVGRLPAPDYPPKNIKEMMDSCTAKGRGDLANKILKQWAAVCDKYPAVRLKWGTACTIGGNSIKKNVFGGKDFVTWLMSQVDEMTPKEVEVAKTIPLIVIPEGTSKIAIPAEKEIPEQWREEANKTREILIQVRSGFAEVAQYITFLEKEASDLLNKIKLYGPNGTKHTTKKGELHAFATRVPKWEAQLVVVEEQLTTARKSTVASEADMINAAHAYEHAPATVMYEVTAQHALAEMSAQTAKLKKVVVDQAGQLHDLREKLAKFEKNEVKASIEVQAGLADAIIAMWEKMMSTWATMLTLVANLHTATAKFSQIAHIKE